MRRRVDRALGHVAGSRPRTKATPHGVSLPVAATAKVTFLRNVGLCDAAEEERVRSLSLAHIVAHWYQTPAPYVT